MYISGVTLKPIVYEEDFVAPLKGVEPGTKDGKSDNRRRPKRLPKKASSP